MFMLINFFAAIGEGVLSSVSVVRFSGTSTTVSEGTLTCGVTMEVTSWIREGSVLSL